MLLLLYFLQNLGKEQKEEDILKNSKQPFWRQRLDCFSVCFIANLPALIVETICQSTAYYCVIIKWRVEVEVEVALVWREYNEELFVPPQSVTAQANSTLRATRRATAPPAGSIVSSLLVGKVGRCAPPLPPPHSILVLPKERRRKQPFTPSTLVDCTGLTLTSGSVHSFVFARFYMQQCPFPFI